MDRVAESEVSELRATVVVDKDVRWFDLRVSDVIIVAGLDAFRDIEAEREQIGALQRPERLDVVEPPVKYSSTS
jgi:hypothetical protein